MNHELSCLLAFPGRPQAICGCEECKELPPASRRMTPIEWEEHCGRGASKNWKASIKIYADPEVPGAPNVSI